MDPAFDDSDDDFVQPSATRPARKLPLTGPAKASAAKRRSEAGRLTCGSKQPVSAPKGMKPLLAPPDRTGGRTGLIASTLNRATSPPADVDAWWADPEQDKCRQQEAGCPICGCDLQQVSDTEAGRQAHVNACLDAVQGAEASRGAAPAPQAPDPSHQLAAPAPVEPACPHSVGEWLASLGLSRWLPEFEGAEVDLEAAAFLCGEDLQEMGIASGEDRATLLAAIGRLSSEGGGGGGQALEEASAPQEEEEEEGAAGWDVGDWEHPVDDDVEPGWPQFDCVVQGGGSDDAGPSGPAAAALTLQPTATVQQQQQPEAASRCFFRQPLSVLPAQQPQQQQRWHPQQHQQSSASASSAASSVPVFTNMFGGPPPKEPAKITQFFGLKAGPSKPQQPAPRSSGLHAGAPATAELVASGSGYAAGPPGCSGHHHQQPNGLAAAAAASGRSLAPAPPVPQWAFVPLWKRIPGTSIIVDGFKGCTDNIKTCPFWILTHFHADHYMGLTKHFNRGTVVCTPVTSALVQLKLRLPAERLLVVPLDTPVHLAGCAITLVDANHCPGAAMVVAHPPAGPPVLHCGDCRLVPAMQGHPALQALRGKATLILDTTYCDPRYTFPSQQEVLAYALRAFAAESSANPRTLFLFGTYTIGKERLFLEVARAANKKVYVCKAKLDILACCGLAPEYRQLLTSDHTATNLHAVPMFKVNLKSMAELLGQYKGRYNMIVGFQPTGWNQAGGAKPGQPARQQARTGTGGAIGKRLQRGGTIVLYQLPYSEHSSFSELREFVQWLRPISIIPSVGNDHGAATRRMLELLTGEAAGAQQQQQAAQGADIRQLFKRQHQAQAAAP